jgi:hypothetical protein
MKTAMPSSKDAEEVTQIIQPGSSSRGTGRRSFRSSRLPMSPPYHAARPTIPNVATLFAIFHRLLPYCLSSAFFGAAAGALWLAGGPNWPNHHRVGSLQLVYCASTRILRRLSYLRHWSSAYAVWRRPKSTQVSMSTGKAQKSNSRNHAASQPSLFVRLIATQSVRNEK